MVRRMRFAKGKAQAGAGTSRQQIDVRTAGVSGQAHVNLSWQPLREMGGLQVGTLVQRVAGARRCCFTLAA